MGLPDNKDAAGKRSDPSAGANELPREIQESRRSYIERRADEMALTGAYINCHAIEVALRVQGYIEARDVLHRPNRRECINALCSQSQRAKGT